MSIFSFFKAQKKIEVEEDIIEYKDCYDFLVQEFPDVNKGDVDIFTNTNCLGWRRFEKKVLINVFKCFLNNGIMTTEIISLEKNINKNLLEEVFGLNKKFLEDNLGDTKLNPELFENKITYYGKRYGDYSIKILFEDIPNYEVNFSQYGSKLQDDIELRLDKPFDLESTLSKSIFEEEPLEGQMIDFQRLVFRNLQDVIKKYSFLKTIHEILKKYSQSQKTGELLNQELPITITFTYSDEPPKKIHFQYLKDYMAYVKSDKLSKHFGISFLK